MPSHLQKHSWRRGKFVGFDYGVFNHIFFIHSASINTIRIMGVLMQGHITLMMNDAVIKMHITVHGHRKRGNALPDSQIRGTFSKNVEARPRLFCFASLLPAWTNFRCYAPVTVDNSPGVGSALPMCSACEPIAVRTTFVNSLMIAPWQNNVEKLQMMSLRSYQFSTLIEDFDVLCKPVVHIKACAINSYVPGYVCMYIPTPLKTELFPKLRDRTLNICISVYLYMY